MSRNIILLNTPMSKNKVTISNIIELKMKSFIALFLFLFFIIEYSFAQKETWTQPKKLKAYTYPMGTVKLSNLIGPNSKSYKYETQEFEESTKFQVVQSEYISSSGEIVNHTIGGNYYKKGTSAAFSLIFDKDDSNNLKVLISFPGRSIGVLNFLKEKENVIKYKFFTSQKPEKNKIQPLVLFYEDNEQGDIEQKLSHIFLQSNLSLYKKQIPEVKNLCLIYYIYNDL